MLYMKKSTNYKLGEITKKSGWRWVWTAISLLLISGGIYLLLLLRAPGIDPLSLAKQQAFIPSEIGNQRVIIPKIAVNVEVKSGDANVLKNGAWHRLPENGNPVDGGNFIVSGHRYILAQTPEDTREQSYFYNIDKLEVGDEILVDWQRKRYKYRVEQISTVAPSQTDIENRSDEPKLTLYTCTLKGQRDGRVVIIAKPVV